MVCLCFQRQIYTYFFFFIITLILQWLPKAWTQILLFELECRHTGCHLFRPANKRVLNVAIEHTHTHTLFGYVCFLPRQKLPISVSQSRCERFSVVRPLRQRGTVKIVNPTEIRWCDRAIKDMKEEKVTLSQDSRVRDGVTMSWQDCRHTFKSVCGCVYACVCPYGGSRPSWYGYEVCFGVFGISESVYNTSYNSYLTISWLYMVVCVRVFHQSCCLAPYMRLQNSIAVSLVHGWGG